MTTQKGDTSILTIIRCPFGHKIIVANSFPFEYKSVKCSKCMKEYEITSKGNIRYANGKPIFKEIKVIV